ncbi:MAG: hypothetical protein KW806_03035 [Candidatus Yanofskybacteria bacterium]|nr:hypothetical protein [Candidatus Yanofskybacteria bacterium]
MNDPFEQFMQQAQHVHLTDHEKGVIRHQLMAHVARPQNHSAFRWIIPAFAFGLVMLAVVSFSIGQTVQANISYSIKEHKVENNIEQLETEYQDLETLAIQAGI